MAAGLESLIQQWTGDPDVANFSLAGVSVWRYMGLNFVMFLGAIQSINAAGLRGVELDGAAGGTSSGTSSCRRSAPSSACP